MWNLFVVLLAVYPEPVYEVERELTPRRQREEKTRQRKANHYRMNSTKVQNPRHKMQVALLAEPKTPLESSVFI